MKSKLALGCFGLLSGLVLLIAIVVYSTSGVVATADDFIGHLAKKEIDQAYALLGSEVTNELNREEFDVFLKGTRLGQAHSATWSSRSLNNGEGRVEGSVALGGDDEQRVLLVLRKVSGNWMIQGIQFPDGLESEGDASEVKAVADAFLESVQKSDYRAAYAVCGELVTAEIDAEAFTSLIESNRLQKTNRWEWTSTKATNIGENLTGKLTLEDGAEYSVSMVLQKTKGSWLIQGFDFQRSAQEDLAAPSTDELKTKTTLLRSSFAAYMDDKKNLEIAKLLETSLASKIEKGALDDLVSSFPNRNAFRAHLDAPVVLTEEPSARQGRLKTVMRTEPDADKNYFIYTVDYLAQGGDWKVYNLDVRLLNTAERPPAPAVSQPW